MVVVRSNIDRQTFSGQAASSTESMQEIKTPEIMTKQSFVKFVDYSRTSREEGNVLRVKFLFQRLFV